MQPDTSSLAMLAVQHPAAPALATQDVNMDAPTALPDEDSRASSSTNSPAPPEAEESDFFLGNNDSQSSLGVPNIQDMQVTDEEDEVLCQAPIYTLPNEILIQIFTKLGSSVDLLNLMLSCKRFARNTVDTLWHRPACTNWDRHAKICRTLSSYQPYFSYRDFVKRLNLASLADDLNDGSIVAFHNCSRIERLTLTKCKKLTDLGLLPLIQGNPNLLALDVSEATELSDNVVLAIAKSCNKIQGLNVSNCRNITNGAMNVLAQNCKYLKRLKLNDCEQMTNQTILAFATNCRNILEIDLQKCSDITNEPVTALLTEGRALRELRLAYCDKLDDSAFLNLTPNRVYEHLRILDLTSCGSLTDRAVEKIIDVAPRLRNLVLAKCRLITDQAVHAISRLGRNLHYVHLGHCSKITDEAVKKLVSACNRIRYIDLGCCANLTDDSVTRLATLPKLKRIGLVKCQSITDKSVLALSQMGVRRSTYRDPSGTIVNKETGHSSLERVHLSYCTLLTIKGIIKLLNTSPRLTHLSLTGVLPFIREDLARFCREAPPDFNEHQRSVFCVYSGQGVIDLRNHFNNSSMFASYREGQIMPTMGEVQEAQVPDEFVAPADDDDDDMGIDDGGVPLQPAGVPGGAAWPGVGPPPPPPPPPAPIQPGAPPATNFFPTPTPGPIPVPPPGLARPSSAAGSSSPPPDPVHHSAP